MGGNTLGWDWIRSTSTMPLRTAYNDVMEGLLSHYISSRPDDRIVANLLSDASSGVHSSNNSNITLLYQVLLVSNIYRNHTRTVEMIVHSINTYQPHIAPTDPHTDILQ